MPGFFSPLAVTFFGLPPEHILAKTTDDKATVSYTPQAENREWVVAVVP